MVPLCSDIHDRLVPETVLRRTEIFSQLRAVKVYNATRVVQNWFVVLDGRKIFGQPETGHVAITATDDALHIYFAKETVGTPRSKHELVEKLYGFCGLNKGTEGERDSKYILSAILDLDTPEDVEDFLDRQRIPKLAPDECQDADSDDDSEADFQPVTQDNDASNPHADSVAVESMEGLGSAARSTSRKIKVFAFRDIKISPDAAPSTQLGLEGQDEEQLGIPSTSSAGMTGAQSIQGNVENTTASTGEILVCNHLMCASAIILSVYFRYTIYWRNCWEITMIR